MAQWEVGDAGLLPQSREDMVDDVLAIAKEFPKLVLVLNHLSGQADGTEQEQALWRAKIAKLASCPNAYAKVGGAGMPDRGYGLADRAVPVGSEELAEMTLRECSRALCVFFAPHKKRLHSVLWLRHRYLRPRAVHVRVQL